MTTIMMMEPCVTTVAMRKAEGRRRPSIIIIDAKRSERVCWKNNFRW
jgi:hypothetical protein